MQLAGVAPGLLYAVQAGKVWKCMIKKHGSKADEELNAILRDKYGCDLNTCDADQREILSKKSPGAEFPHSPQPHTHAEAKGDTEGGGRGTKKDENKNDDPGSNSTSSPVPSSPSPGKPPLSARPTPSPSPTGVDKGKSGKGSLLKQAVSMSPGTSPMGGETELPLTVGAEKPKNSTKLPASQLATPPLRPIKTPLGQTSPAADAATQEMLVARLEAFYEIVNPGECHISFRCRPLTLWCRSKLIVASIFFLLQNRSSGAGRKAGEKIQQQSLTPQSRPARKVWM